MSARTPQAFRSSTYRSRSFCRRQQGAADALELPQDGSRQVVPRGTHHGAADAPLARRRPVTRHAVPVATEAAELAHQLLAGLPGSGLSARLLRGGTARHAGGIPLASADSSVEGRDQGVVHADALVLHRPATGTRLVARRLDPVAGDGYHCVSTHSDTKPQHRRSRGDRGTHWSNRH